MRLIQEIWDYLVARKKYRPVIMQIVHLLHSSGKGRREALMRASACWTDVQRVASVISYEVDKMDFYHRAETRLHGRMCTRSELHNLLRDVYEEYARLEHSRTHFSW